jgi:DNA repair exonuclease SbcCD ATPase subunit
MIAKKIALPALLLLLQACTQDPKTSEPYKQLEEDQRRTTETVAQRDSAINELFGTFNRISENLRTIRAKQGALVAPAGGSESGADMEQRVMEDLAAIDALLAENKELIAKLRKQSKSSAARITELERTIVELESTITAKNAEIDTLKEELSSANSSLATLIDMYRDKSQLADMQRNEMNTANYLIGTSKELKEKGVLTKEGGVVGIGAVNKLNMANLPKDQFTEVDLTATPEIAIGAKKASLATAHPEGSYRLEGGTRLVITDAEKFWSVSRYLVVVVER